MSWFVHNFHQTLHMVLKVYTLSCSYLDVFGYFNFFSIFMHQLCSGGFKQSKYVTLLLPPCGLTYNKFV